MVDWTALGASLEGDGEFRFAARHWTATLRLDVGGDSRLVRMEDGHVAGVEPCDAGRPCDIFISAPEEVWDQMLQPVPRPFFQDFFVAQLHHGLVMNPDMLDYAAYYPALRRMLEVLRESAGAR